MSSSPQEPLAAWTSQVLSYVAMTLSLAVLLKYLLTARVPENIPPFPAKPYPILGHVTYFKDGMRKPLIEWAKSTGELFSLYFGSDLVVILNSHDVYHKAFVKHADTLSDRPKSLAGDIGGEDPNKGILFASGPVWKEQRSVSIQILKSFGMGKNILAPKISEEVSTYLETLSQLSGQPSDVRTLTQTAIANIICSIVVGKRFEYHDMHFTKFIQKFEQLARLNQSASLYPLFPWLRHLPGDFFKAKERIHLYKYIVDHFCCESIKKTISAGSGDGKENFISAYLQEKRRQEDKGQATTLDEENLARTIYSLFAAGIDTTSTFILWFMVYMVHYPHIQTQIFAEISEKVGLERSPDMNDKTKFDFINAAILETLRLSMAPLSLPHQCRADTTINGYTIPAGTTVVANLESIIWSADSFKDPEQFRPQRFLDDHGKFIQPENFSLFGVGRRSCPGEFLAKMELFLFLTSLLQRFELHPATPGQLPSLDPQQGVVYSPRPFQVRLVARRCLEHTH